MTRGAARLAMAALLGGLLLSAASSSATGDRYRTADLDLTASAHAGEPGLLVADEAFDVLGSNRRLVKADTSATTSTGCTGCAADAVTLHVLYLSRSHAAHLENAAVTWVQQCGQCRSTALSVQVVVVGRGEVTANNRALAVNATCSDCATSAAAYQLVVMEPREERLSHSGLGELRDWVDAQAAALRDAPPALSRKPEAGRLRTLKRSAARELDSLGVLVNADLGSVTVSADVDVMRPL